MTWIRIANLALSKLFEPPCAACGATLARPLEGAVCGLCWAGIHRITPPVCHRCGDPLSSSLACFTSGGTCRQCCESRYAVDHSRAIGPYEGGLRDIIHALKYDGRRSIASRLASMMRGMGVDVLSDADCVVPVPLHPRRERARGFNQAADLANGLGLPVMHLLRRTIATTPQVDLPAHERARNVRDAFALTAGLWLPVAGSRLPVLRTRLSAYAADQPPLKLRRSAEASAKAEGRYGVTSPTRLRQGYGGPPKHLRRRKLADVHESEGGPVEGLVIVLIDDVSTTGATLEACAEVLKAAGAKSVRALTAARVVSGRP